MLPGTGGLTRVVDKRGVRRDLADVFSTTAEGIRGDRAVQWRLVDGDRQGPRLRRRDRPPRRRGGRDARPGPAPARRASQLTPLNRAVDGDTTSYEHVRVVLDRDAGTATITVLGPTAVPASVEELHEQGDRRLVPAMTRQLDDVILRLRTNELTIGTWLLRTEGDVATVAAYDEFLLANRDDWLVNETIGFYKRTVKRLDTTQPQPVRPDRAGQLLRRRAGRDRLRRRPLVHARGAVRGGRRPEAAAR